MDQWGFVCVVQEEMARLQQSVEELKAAAGQDNEEEKVPTRPAPFCPLLPCHSLTADCVCVLQERKQLIDRQYEGDREKLQRMRLLMVTERQRGHDNKQQIRCSDFSLLLFFPLEKY